MQSRGHACAGSDLARVLFLVGRVAVMHLVHVETTAAQVQAKRAAAERRAEESGQAANGELAAACSSRVYAACQTLSFRTHTLSRRQAIAISCF